MDICNYPENETKIAAKDLRPGNVTHSGTVASVTPTKVGKLSRTYVRFTNGGLASTKPEATFHVLNT